jgi:hypothetical protein
MSPSDTDFIVSKKKDFFSPVNVEKSGIIYITISIVLILFSYYPLILSPFTLSKYEPGRDLRTYNKADYPYAPRRLFLRVLFKTDGILYSGNVKHLSNILRFFGGMRLTALITILTGIAYALRTAFLRVCINCLPPNAFIYDKVYVFDQDITQVIIATAVCLICLLPLHVYILYIPFEDQIVFVCLGRNFLQSIPVSCFLNDAEHRTESNTLEMLIVTRFCLMFSIGFWCKLFSLPLNISKDSRCRIVLKLIISPIIFVFYASLFIVFSCFPMFNIVYLAFRFFFVSLLSKSISKHRTFKRRLMKRKYRCRQDICALFGTILAIVECIGFVVAVLSNAIYIGMSYIVQFLVYFLLVAMPHLSSTQLRIFFISTTTITYMSKFILDFLHLYRLLLQALLHIKGTDEIEVNVFDTIVQRCCPVSKEFFFLFAKVLMTSFLLIIMYLTLNELNFLHNEDSVDLNTFLVYVFILLTPGILEILFFESNANKVERMHHELHEQVRKLDMGDSLYDIEENAHKNREAIDLTNFKCNLYNLSELACNCRFVRKFICLCCCGCLDSHCGDKGHCKCCYSLREVHVDTHGGEYHTIEPFTLRTLWYSRNKVHSNSMNESHNEVNIVRIFDVDNEVNRSHILSPISLPSPQFSFYQSDNDVDNDSIEVK